MDALDEIEDVFHEYDNDVLETESQIVDRIREIIQKTKFVKIEIPSGRYFLVRMPENASFIGWSTEEWNTRSGMYFKRNGEPRMAFTNQDTLRLGFDISRLEKIKNDVWFVSHVAEEVASTIVGRVIATGIELTFPENERFQGFIDYEDSAYSFETAKESFKSLLKKHNTLDGKLADFERKWITRKNIFLSF